MGFVQYFIESNVPFGGISYAMVFVWAITLAFGIYLLRSYTDTNPVRVRFAKQVGTILSGLSAAGLVLLILKFVNVPILEWRLWSYLVAIASIGYAAYALYVYNSKLPAQAAAVRTTRSGNRASGGARTYAAHSATATPRPPREPRPVATTTRRDARREKKRRGR